MCNTAEGADKEICHYKPKCPSEDTKEGNHLTVPTGFLKEKTLKKSLTELNSFFHPKNLVTPNS